MNLGTRQYRVPVLWTYQGRLSGWRAKRKGMSRYSGVSRYSGMSRYSGVSRYSGAETQAHAVSLKESDFGT